MTMVHSREAPGNTAFIAMSLVCRYLTAHDKKVLGRAAQEALLVAGCLLAFKVAEEVDLDIDHCLKQFRLACNRRQVLSAERKICVRLEWRLNGPVTVEEAGFAILDALDASCVLDQRVKGLLVQCCGDLAVRAFFECKPGGGAVSVVSIVALCLEKLLRSLSKRLGGEWLMGGVLRGVVEVPDKLVDDYLSLWFNKERHK
jgi:hypothetical protein